VVRIIYESTYAFRPRGCVQCEAEAVARPTFKLEGGCFTCMFHRPMGAESCCVQETQICWQSDAVDEGIPVTVMYDSDPQSSTARTSSRRYRRYLWWSCQRSIGAGILKRKHLAASKVPSSRLVRLRIYERHPVLFEHHLSLS
jgi:hypothetical protein